MATILISGGTGMIGKALTAALLKRNHAVIILSRQQARESRQPNVSYAHWDVAGGKIDEDAIRKTDHIVHLAGAGVADKRWTKKRKQEIVDSRVKTSELLVRSLAQIPNHVKSIVSASAIGWYGSDPAVPNPKPFTEDDPADGQFLGQTCRLWESSIGEAAKLGKRIAWLRTGIVLSNEGGALVEFKRPLKFGIAPILGNGKQIISWIHIEDLVRMYVASIENENMNGVYNAVAPSPVSNKTFMMELARVERGKFFIPVYVPSFALKLALGEMSIEVLKSSTVSCDKVHRTGFSFLFPGIGAALRDLKDR